MKLKFLLTAVALAFLVSTVGCETTPVQNGALEGGLLGAAAGAVIGNNSHHRAGNGALIGGGLGALAGALIGDATQQGGGTRYRQAPVAQAAPPPPPAQEPVQVAPPAPPVQAAPLPPPPPSSNPGTYGHWESQIVKTPSGETYEQRVWVPNGY